MDHTMSFAERARIGMKMLAEQPLVPYEEKLIQIKRRKERSNEKDQKTRKDSKS